ncbi:MAG: hypothetical protein AB7H90_23795 [Alphaproteobacteria bacterium]
MYIWQRILAFAVVGLTFMFCSPVDAQQSANQPSTFKMMRNADEAGNYPEAVRLALKIIQEGDNVRYSPKLSMAQVRGFQHETRAVAAGYLAKYYDQGLGVSRDYGKAAYYYELSLADLEMSSRYQGVPHGPVWATAARLGTMYAHGVGVPRDRAKARAIFVGMGKPGIELVELLDTNRLPNGGVNELAVAMRQMNADKAAAQQAQAAIAARNPPPSRPSARSGADPWASEKDPWASALSGLL